MKVIFLSYANSLERPLDTLNQGDDSVQRSLLEANRGLFYIHREPYATLERINEALDIYTGHVALFHFSGHAGRDSLLFNEVAANSDGIAY
ncbi:MAG: hypothetical protein INR73_11110 [Williamsia sp.]|nr:hypothetical protein [Williamsia sp.]